MIDAAGAGLPLALWRRRAQAGEDAWQRGIRDIAAEEGWLSHRSMSLVEAGGQPVAVLAARALPDPLPPVDPATLWPPLRPLFALDAKVPGAYYVSALAVAAGRRGRGLGSALLALAAERGRAAGHGHLALIVGSGNPAARLYRRFGLEESARAPALSAPDYRGPDRHFLLMEMAL